MEGHHVDPFIAEAKRLGVPTHQLTPAGAETWEQVEERVKRFLEVSSDHNPHPTTGLKSYFHLLKMWMVPPGGVWPFWWREGWCGSRRECACVDPWWLAENSIGPPQLQSRTIHPFQLWPLQATYNLWEHGRHSNSTWAPSTKQPPKSRLPQPPWRLPSPQITWAQEKHREKGCRWSGTPSAYHGEWWGVA